MFGKRKTEDKMLLTFCNLHFYQACPLFQELPGRQTEANRFGSKKKVVSVQQKKYLRIAWFHDSEAIEHFRLSLILHAFAMKIS